MRVTANGVSLHVEERSDPSQPEDSPTLVFLHYFGGSSQAWHLVMDRLGENYRCIAPDLRGFGDSEAPGTGYAVADGANDIAALAAALGLKSYVLVGHSMGGKIALALAARRPLGLRSLILLAPSPPTPEPMREEDRARLLRTHGDERAALETAAKITAVSLPDASLRQVVKDNLRSSPVAWAAWLEHGSREDISPQMSAITVPVLVVAGEADAVLPPKLLERELVGRIKQAKMVVVPRTGHLSPWEAPVPISDIIHIGVALNPLN